MSSDGADGPVKVVIGNINEGEENSANVYICPSNILKGALAPVTHTSYSRIPVSYPVRGIRTPRDQVRMSSFPQFSDDLSSGKTFPSGPYNFHHRHTHGNGFAFVKLGVPFYQKMEADLIAAEEPAVYARPAFGGRVLL